MKKTLTFMFLIFMIILIVPDLYASPNYIEGPGQEGGGGSSGKALVNTGNYAYFGDTYSNAVTKAYTNNVFDIVDIFVNPNNGLFQKMDSTELYIKIRGFSNDFYKVDGQVFYEADIPYPGIWLVQNPNKISLKYMPGYDNMTAIDQINLYNRDNTFMNWSISYKVYYPYTQHALLYINNNLVGTDWNIYTTSDFKYQINSNIPLDAGSTRYVYTEEGTLNRAIAIPNAGKILINQGYTNINQFPSTSTDPITNKIVVDKFGINTILN